MPDAAEARAATAALHGHRLYGRALRVNQASGDGRSRSRSRSDAATSPVEQLRPSIGRRPSRCRGPVRRPTRRDTQAPWHAHQPTGRMPSRGGAIRRPLKPTARHRRAQTATALAAATIFLAAVAASVLLNLVSPWIFVAYLALSLFALVVYAVDKDCAAHDSWRVPESTLHLLALAGGWPGAFVARYWLRHKTVKQPFRIVFSLTIIANCACFAWLATAGGALAGRDLEHWFSATFSHFF